MRPLTERRWRWAYALHLWSLTDLPARHCRNIAAEAAALERADRGAWVLTWMDPLDAAELEVLEGGAW